MQGLTVVMVIVGGVALSILSAVSEYRAESVRVERDFHDVAADRSEAIESVLNSYVDVLGYVERLFHASESVTQTEFLTFVAPFLDEHPDLKALEWIERVPASALDETADTEKRGAPQLIRDGTVDGTAWQTMRPADRFLVRYAEPMELRRSVVGRDLMDEAVCRDAIVLATEKGQSMSSLSTRAGPQTATSDTAAGWARVFLPVFAESGGPLGGESRHRDVRGLIAAVIDPLGSLQSAVASVARSADAVDTFVVDLVDPDAPQIIFSDLSAQRSPGDRRGYDEEAMTAGLHNRQFIHAAGRPFAVISAPTQAFLRARETWFAWGILAAGAACSGLLAACISLIDRRARAVDQINRDLRGEIEERRRVQEQLVTAKESAEHTNAQLEKQIAERVRAEQDRSESESRLRELAENINDVLYVSDPEEGTILYISPAYEDVWGRSAERLIGHPGDWVEAIHPDDREAVLASKDRASSVPVQVQYRIVRDDGSLRWIADRSVPVRDDDGLIRRVVGIAEDMTDRKRSEEQLTHALKALRDSQLQLIQAAKLESVGRLAAGVAHEVKNPLATILLGINYLVDEGFADDPSLKQVVGSMKASVSRADKVIRGLLDFASPREIDLQPQDLNEVIEDSLLLVRGDLLHSHVDVQCDLAEQLLLVSLDTSKLQQVLINLFVNACHAMPEGGTINVRTSAIDREGGPCVEVRVDDSGSGIPEDKLQKIFDPFFTTKPIGEGTGLGLSVSKKIVDLHHGTIHFSNRPEGGVRVVLTFPALTEGRPAWTGSGYSSSTTK